MARICLISPGHLSTNPRLVKEADALASAGYAVEVISGYYSPWAVQADTSCTSELWHWVATVPFGPQAPWFVRLRHLATTRLARLLWGCGLQHHTIGSAAWHPLCSDLFRQALSRTADLYIAHYPAALPAAALAAKKHKALYAFDAEDFHLGDPPETPGFDTQRALLRSIEARWLPGAAYITAASPGIADAYAATYGLPAPTVLRNMFPLAQAPPEPTASGSVVPGPTVYWFSQTIGPDRGLECAVRSLALARCSPHLHLRGSISASYRLQLFALAEQLGVNHRLHLHQPAPPEQMERLASEYDVGLVAETVCTPNRRIALTNKLFTYALAGIPCLLSDIPAHRAVMAEAGDAAQLFNQADPASLAAALDAWLAAPPAVLAGARAAAYRLGQETWNWECEQTKLLERVATVFHRHPCNHESRPT